MVALVQLAGDRATGAIVPAMTAAEARACVARIRAHLDGARAELLRLHEAEGWRALGYATLRECMVAEFGQSQAALYRQLQVAQIEARVSSAVEIGTTPARHLLPLARLPEDERPAAWRAIVATAPGGQVTGAHAAAVAERFKDPARLAAHFSSATPEWYTPAHVLARVVDFFGAVDLDPCSNSHEAPNVPARCHYTAADDGLARPWLGRVFLNPPYGEGVAPWVAKLDAHYRAGEIEAGVALLSARMETRWFRPLYDYAICFITGRLRFARGAGEGGDNGAPFPSVLVYLGEDVARFAEAFESLGPVLRRVGGAR